MTVNLFCKEDYEIANDTFKKIEKIEEIQTNLGTFIELTEEGGAVTSLTKRHIKRLEIV